MDSSIVVPPKPTKNNLMVLGVGCFVILAVLYFVYRFVKNMNKRINSMEEILGRLIEKTNQLQHFIQQQPPIVRQTQAPPVQIPPPACPVEKSPPTSVPVSPVQAPAPTQTAARVNPPRRPSPPVVQQPAVVNLDEELQDELNELQPVKKEDDVLEGRVDE